MKGRRWTWKRKCMLCMLPGIVGTAVFFVIPFLRVLHASFIDNQFQKNFVGWENYVEVLQNEYFRLALINSLLMIGICVPLLMVLALGLSVLLSLVVRRLRFLRTAFVLPMVIPTAAIVLVWRMLFADTSTVLPLYLLFIWKNIGVCIILLTAAFSAVDSSVFEAARLDGAGGVRLHRYITIPMVMPTILFCTLLSVVNSFKVYKESYLLYGTNYPPDHSYTLQYYMNNHFLKLDYQCLSVSAVLTSLLVLLLVLMGLRLQRRYSR